MDARTPGIIVPGGWFAANGPLPARHSSGLGPFDWGEPKQ